MILQHICGKKLLRHSILSITSRRLTQHNTLIRDRFSIPLGRAYISYLVKFSNLPARKTRKNFNYTKGYTLIIPWRKRAYPRTYTCIISRRKQRNTKKLKNDPPLFAINRREKAPGIFVHPSTLYYT